MNHPFKRDYNKPGPGVPKNAPPKKGLARFGEIFARDFGALCKLNWLYLLCMLPAQLALAGAFLCLVGVLPLGFMGLWVFAGVGLVASVPVGPALTAIYRQIISLLRNEPVFLWHNFKKTFRENFRATALPGVVYSLVLGAQMLGFFFYASYQGQMGLPLLALYLFTVLLFALCAPYYFIQAAYIQLPLAPKLRNSLILGLSNAPRSFMGALFGVGLVLAQLAFLPATLPVLLVLGYSLPLLIQLMWVWPPADKAFQIDETLRARKAAQQPPDQPA